MVVICIIAVIIIVMSSRPATGVVHNAKPTTTPAKTSARTNQHYTDAYVAFDYPSDFSQAAEVNNNKTYLDSLQFVGASYQNSLLAIAVRPGNVSTDPGVAQRQADTSRYRSQPINIKGAVGVLSIEQNTSEFGQAAFVEHDGRLISIAISDPDGRDLTSIFQGVLDSWSWPQ